MSGELPVTIAGHQSYSLAKSLVRTELDELLAKKQAEYGLTDIEVLDILAEVSRSYARWAVRDQQMHSSKRKGVSGTPREGGR